MHKLSERNMFKDNLFLARSWEILTKIAFVARNTTLAKFLQEIEKVLQDSCKNFARCIFYKNFAKVVLIARILQDFCKSCFSCELGNTYSV